LRTRVFALKFVAVAEPSRQPAATRRAPSRRIFQVAYDQALLFTRAELLKSRGYLVESVFGNDEAKRYLDGASGFDLFIIGHAADRRTREEMAEWLRERFPAVRILALNPPHHPELANADYNIRQNGPEVWLDLLSSKLG
jgi:hypothetical protein